MSAGDELFDWYSGIHYEFAWGLYITVLVIAVLTNGLCLFINCFHPDVRKTKMALLVRWLNGEDFIYSLMCLIQCCINLAHKQLVGKYSACAFQAGFSMFFILATAYSLLLISYDAYVTIVKGRKGVTSKFAFIYHMVAYVIILGITLVCVVVWPAGLVASGTYCMPNLNFWPITILFYVVGLGTVAVCMTYCYVNVFLTVRKDSLRLSTGNYSKAEIKAQKRQKRLTIRLSMFVVVFCICYSPLAVGAVMFWAGVGTPPSVDILFGVLCHGQSFFNPLLYFWMNKNSRKAVLSYFGLSQRFTTRTEGISDTQLNSCTPNTTSTGITAFSKTNDSLAASFDGAKHLDNDNVYVGEV